MQNIRDFRAQTMHVADWSGSGPVPLVMPEGVDVVGNMLVIGVCHNISFTDWPQLQFWGFTRIAAGGGINDASGPGFIHDWWAREISGTEGWVGDGTDFLDLRGDPMPAYSYGPLGHLCVWCLEDAGMPVPWDETTFMAPWPSTLQLTGGGFQHLATTGPAKILGPPAGMTGRTAFDTGPVASGIECIFADRLVTTPGASAIGPIPVTTGEAFQGRLFIPTYADSDYGIGKNLPSIPDWYSRLWRVDDWELDGAGAVRLTGVTIDADVPVYGEALMSQGQSPFMQELPGPYDAPHTVRIRFSWDSLASTSAFMAKWSYAWQNYSDFPYETVRVVMVDDVNSSLPGLYLHDPDDIFGTPAYHAMTFTPGEDYILEVDFTTGTRVKCALAADIEAAPYLLSFGASYSGDTFFVVGHASENKVIYIKHMDFFKPGGPPPSGTILDDHLVGMGDGVTTTFTGYPTSGRVIWRVNGIVTEPLDYDASTGEVTFTRAPDDGMFITQSGTVT